MTRIMTACRGRGSASVFLPLLLLVFAFAAFPTATNAQVSSFPYLESFESGSGAWSTGGGSYSMWTRDSGGTTSSNTGPSTGHNSTWYYYIETSSSGTGGYDYLTANFNFSTLSLPVFSFYYHMYGAAMGSLSVELSTNSGATWNTEWSKSGQQHSSSAAAYSQGLICLTAYANMSNVRIRFKGVDGSSFTGDAAVDYIQVYQGSALTYTTSIAEQPNLGPVSPSATNVEMLRLKVNVNGDCGGPETYQLTCNTNGTTNVSDITNARLYYTGNNPNFSTANQIGSTVSSPPAAPSTFTFSGTVMASGGDNYFWLVYDASASAPTGNYLDAECTQLQIGASTYTPTVTAPSGSRMFMAPLSGVYTINPSGSGSTNFPSFSDAVAALDLLGISGPVTFQVAAGTYNEQVTMGTISGANATNTVTFDGGAGNAATRILQYSAPQYRGVVELMGTDYVRFRNITVNSTNSSYGYGFWFYNQADYNEITDCVMTFPPNSTSSYHIGIAATTTNDYDGYGNHGNYNLFKNNVIRDAGYYGISFTGSSSSSSTTARGNQFIDNEVTGFYYYGMRIYYSAAVVITGNKIVQRSTGTYTTSSGYGLYV